MCICRPIYEEKQIEPMRQPKKIAAISSGLMARLDQPQRTSQMQGTRVSVLAQLKLTICSVITQECEE